MKKIFFFISTLASINLFLSCTPPQQTTEGERIYVFDNQKNEDKIEVKKD